MPNKRKKKPVIIESSSEDERNQEENKTPIAELSSPKNGLQKFDAGGNQNLTLK